MPTNNLPLSAAVTQAIRAEAQRVASEWWVEVGDQRPLADALTAFGEALYRRGLADGRSPQWESIESAPKDGTRILLARGLTVVSGWWSGGDAFNMPHWSTLTCDQDFTHWLPLPLPPTGEDAP